MPSRKVLHAEVIRIMEDPVRRDVAFAALAVLDEAPALHFSTDDGHQVEIPFMDIWCQGQRAPLFEERVLTAMAWQDVLRGKYIYCFIQVQREPFKDAQIFENRALLKDMVAHYQSRGLYDFVDADFWAGNNGADGFVEFAAPPIRDFKGVSTDVDGQPNSVQRPDEPTINGTATRFPLEVGFCLPDQMAFHLARNGQVARLPYGHDWMILLERVG